MGPYGMSAAAGEGWMGGDFGGAGCPAPDIDGLLAEAGYRVRSSDLRQVARRLERLESAMVGEAGPACLGSAAAAAQVIDQQQQMFLAPDAVHYNPSDLAAWVDSMLSEISPSQSSSKVDPCHKVEDDLEGSPPAQVYLEQAAPPSVVAPPPLMEEEDSGIRLVHILMTCAEAVQRGDSGLAGALIEEMRPALARVGTRFGIGKVAGYFIDALSRRLYSPPHALGATARENEALHHRFYEACPYLKFAHFTANQAILEAFDGHDRVHVVDFNLMQGLQWPALIQALALRPGGPPALRLTGIGPPSPDGRDTLRDVGFRLAELAKSVAVPFAFRGVAANRLDDVRAWMLRVSPLEAVAVNSVMQLHRLLEDPEEEEAAAMAGGASPIESVLGWIRGLRPKIVALVEQEANHNKSAFLDRFTEALFYYSTMFDSLEGGSRQAMGMSPSSGERAAAEAYLQREICNIVCCEGPARVERHEPLGTWRRRMTRAGFRPAHLGSNAFKQASMLLSLFSEEGYCVDEVDGSLTLGWHSRPLISASAWAVNADADGPLPGGADDPNLGALPPPGLPVAPPRQASNNDHRNYDLLPNDTETGGCDGGDSDHNKSHHPDGNVHSGSSAWSGGSGNAATCSAGSSSNHRSHLRIG